LALVMGGGGARGAYQVGVLAGLAERLPGLEFPILTGTSVGAINTIYLAAHPGPLPAAAQGLRAAWDGLDADAVYHLRSARLGGWLARWVWQTITRKRRGPVVVRGLADTQPLREFLERTVDPRAIADNVVRGRVRSVAVSATSYTTGRSVTFVQGGADVPTWERAQRIGVRTELTLDHVMASAALPIVFPAVRIGEEFYGDGSVRQMAPLAPAIHLGARAVVAIGLRTPRGVKPAGREGKYPSAAEAMGLLFDAIFLDALEADAERLERINHLLAALQPEGNSPDGMRSIELLVLHPTRNLSELATGQGHLLPANVRHAVRAMGGHEDTAADFLSFLLFHPEHTARLAEAGYDDVASHWPDIERFFEKLERTIV
jgi:NTE family protein